MPHFPHFSSRIDVVELKAQIISKIGDERADKYFYYLNRLLNLKLSKSDFNKLCIGAIGKENVLLHNRFIESIIKNACVAKSPPCRVRNGYHRNNLQFLYGGAFPRSPRRGRPTNLGDRRLRDRPSPLGSNGNVRSVVYDELYSRTPEKENLNGLVSMRGRPLLQVVSVEDGEEIEQLTASPSFQSRLYVSAPLGIQMDNGGGVRKTLRGRFLSSLYSESTCNGSVLLDTLSLRRQLERILDPEGFGISMDCANVLNLGLDRFLKRLIKPCLELARLRNGNECIEQVNGPGGPGVNGIWRERCLQRSTCFSASALDFRVAMELNPKLLGETWPVQLERVCLHTSDE